MVFIIFLLLLFHILEKHLILHFIVYVVRSARAMIAVVSFAAVLVKRVPALLTTGLSIANSIFGCLVAARLVKSTANSAGSSPLQDDPLLIHSAQVLLQLFCLLFKLIVLLCESFNLALLFLGLQFCISSILVVLSAKLIYLFPLFLGCVRYKLEILLPLLERFLLFSELTHFIFLHSVDLFACFFALSLKLTLLSFDLAQHVVILSFLLYQISVVVVVPSDSLLKLFLLFLQQSFHLRIHEWLGLVIF